MEVPMNSLLNKILVLAVVIVVLGCTRTDTPQMQSPIVFAGGQLQPEEQTRADVPLEDLYNTFRTYTYKIMTVDNALHNVMPGYQVKYVSGSAGSTTSNTDGWEYVFPSSQTIRYWDYEARYYYFAGYAPADAPKVTKAEPNTLNPDLFEIHIDGLQAGPSVPPVMVSEPTFKLHHQFASVVRMPFFIPMTKVRVGFKTTSGDGLGFDVSNISFAPIDPMINIPQEANLTCSYMMRKPVIGGVEPGDLTVTTTSQSGNLGSLTFDETHGMSLPSTDVVWVRPTGKPIAETDYYYYVFPQDPTNWRLKLKVKGVDADFRTSDVPASYMEWQPGKVYTYIFKVSISNIVLELVKVDDWTVFEIDKTVTTW